MSKKLWWIIGILLVVIIALVMLKKSGAIGKEEGFKVSTEKVARKTIVETVTANGKIYPEIEVKVSPDVSGEITELTVAEGDSVHRGQVVARIYADIYNSQRDQAAAIVNQQSAQVENSSAALEAFKARLDQAKITYDRQKQLVDEKVISKAEFETADQAYKTAQADYNAALKGIKGGQAAVQSAQAQLQKANKDLGRTTIVAPMDGVVSLLAVKKGERVAGNSFNVGTEMMRIADMDKIEVRVDVGENDIPKVKLGDSADVEVDAYNDRKFKGVVTQIASTSKSLSSNALSSASSTDVTNYEVRIRLDKNSYLDLIESTKAKKAFPFRPGMSANADIKTRTAANVVAVPILSVATREKEDEKSKVEAKERKEKEKAQGNETDSKVVNADDLDVVVFVYQQDGTVKRVKIKTGIQDNEYIEVSDGLKEGDEVVSGPYNAIAKTLKDKEKVKVVPKDKLYDIKK
ncbi:MAG: efflux RND transporter periplasmic adaptor subunit [Sphingobacteriales bacterium]|nr:efflux RND transporter periplasmic adaptor subunit [Sphingobacteriales bacterium]